MHNGVVLQMPVPAEYKDDIFSELRSNFEKTSPSRKTTVFWLAETAPDPIVCVRIKARTMADAQLFSTGIARYLALLELALGFVKSGEWTWDNIIIDEGDNDWWLSNGQSRRSYRDLFLSPPMPKKH